MQSRRGFEGFESFIMFCAPLCVVCRRNLSTQTPEYAFSGFGLFQTVIYNVLSKFIPSIFPDELILAADFFSFKNFSRDAEDDEV